MGDDTDVFNKIMSENINEQNTKVKTKTQSTSPRTLNRAHSRISDHRKRKNAAADTNSIPSSFLHFKQQHNNANIMRSRSQTTSIRVNRSTSPMKEIDFESKEAMHARKSKPKHSRFASVTNAMMKGR